MGWMDGEIAEGPRNIFGAPRSVPQGQRGRRPSWGRKMFWGNRDFGAGLRLVETDEEGRQGERRKEDVARHTAGVAQAREQDATSSAGGLEGERWR